MTKMAFAVTLGAALFIGCGDDAPPSTDTGPGDTGTTDTSVPEDAGGPGTGQVMRVRYVDSDEVPIEGVMVAVDTDLGRFEAVSNAAGEIALDYRYMEDASDMVAALEGHLIVAWIAQPYEVPEQADGFFVTTLSRLSGGSDERVRFFADATGVPAGGRWCAGLISFYNGCQDEGVTWDQRLRPSLIQDRLHDHVYGFALDDTGALYDFVRAEWVVMPDGGRTVSLAFDGAFDEAPLERDVTINLPTDPESPFRTETLDESWQGWLAAVEPGTHLTRSALTMVSVGTNAVTMRIHYFPVTGDELIWNAAPAANLSDGARAFQWFAATPPDAPLEVLDLARVKRGTAWTDEFEWTVPAMDVDRYIVRFMGGGGLSIVSMLTNDPFATVPALPSGYDPMISFPFPGAPGNVQIVSVRGDAPPDDTASDPYRVDAEASWSLRSPITF